MSRLVARAAVLLLLLAHCVAARGILVDVNAVSDVAAHRKLQSAHADAALMSNKTQLRAALLTDYDRG